ncbi:GNAT family N-acetyltransferase [Nocardioides pantholopis]|uniref:GNAT family N-acetyltransferase n=1 Tax=Nocardioides pantholopis TaxID=2483798 RepID=UPI000FD6ED0D|nr:GNAT family N-acetyltransferase [Nocardioides pantholopis]
MSEPAGGLRVRRATPADHGPAGAVTVAAYAELLAGPEDPYVARLRDAARRDREAELWVAESLPDGIVVGTVTLCPPGPPGSPGSPWREIAEPDEGEFRMLAVAPTARRRGVGEALARLAIDRFTADGADAVVLSSLVTMTAAHRLYERLGFTRLPERDHAPRPGMHLIAYRKEL